MALMRPLEQWPLVLCGPMLRRVEANAVTVFVALKSPCHVTLRIHRHSPSAALDVAYGTAETVAIGTYLHVVAITAEPTNAYLQPDVIYSYDLAFESATATVGSLIELSQFQGAGSLSYAGSAGLPTFQLLPDHYADLRLLHASCRLPHAERRDAFRAVDSILEDWWFDQNLVRPHALFLTGDQIYADDVAPAMLRMAMEIGGAALGWPETLPGGLDPRSFELAPERRLALLWQHGFTSNHAHSHLMTFAEYVGMYLLVWSDELWPRSSGGGLSLPSQNEVFHHLQWLDPAPTPRAEEFVRAKNRYQETVANLTGLRFQDALPQVRRALANIPTYMMFDDHEVTDDWNIYQEWEDNVYASSLGARVVQNGLAAFAVFQAWGNQPQQFVTGTAGRDLLTRISQWRGDQDANLQRIAVRLGMPNTLPEVPSVRWDYELAAGDYRFIVLDTRTQRRFPTASNLRLAARLLGEPAQATQIANRLGPHPDNYAVTFFVSPAPVIGHPFVERDIQEGGVNAPIHWTYIGGWPMPTREAAYDYEAWSFHRPALEALLREISRCGRVVVLSGDVHYGFSAGVDYWDEATATSARIVQLTASGLKNETGKTRFIGGVVPMGTAVLGWPSSDLAASTGWDSPTDPVATYYVDGSPWKDVFLRSRARILEYPYPEAGGPAKSQYVSGSKGPMWRYRIRFVSDQRDADKRVSGVSVLQNRWAVGNNNLGDVSFPAADLVRHALWYVAEEASSTSLGTTARPYTMHEINLNLPGSSIPKPDIARVENFE